MNDTTIGQRIADERKKLGLSQEALGEKMGVSRQAISKWEADAAMPEIDKLIALSKLFGVSVGWLLGVEEKPGKQSEELNETQLKMVEEIVKRYQPTHSETMEMKFPWIIAMALFAAALAITVSMFYRMDSNSPDYSQQIANLQNNYSSIQSQLSSLDDRLNELAEAADSSSKLLLSYDMELTEIIPGSLDSENIVTGPNTSDIIVDFHTAALRFSAVTKQRTDSDTAYLSVLLDGSEIKRVECQRYGIGCSAELMLSLLDGYEFCFVLRTGDGTEQIQMLDLPGFDFLYTNNTLRCGVITPTYAIYTGSSLEFDCLTVDAAMPDWLSKTRDLHWADYGFILYVNGKEINRMSCIGDHLVDNNSINFSIDFTNIFFYDITLTEGDEIELRFFAKPNNGMVTDAVAGCWIMEDGTLIEAAPVNEY